MISIIVPIYNTGDSRLKKCLNSLRKQTYENWEAILINDASTDNSLSICNYYVQKDRRFSLINKTTNEGVEKARFDGVQSMKGRYVTFVDADDWLEQDMLEHSRKLIEEYDCDYVEMGIRRCFDRLGILTKKAQQFTTGFIAQEELEIHHNLSFYGLYSLGVNICGKLYKKELMAFFPPPIGLRHGEDQHVSFVLHQHIHSIYRTNKPGYNYLWGGMTSKYNASLLSDFKRLYHIRRNYLHNNTPALDFRRKAEYFMSIEAANFLRTEIQQLLRFNSECDFEDIVTIISDELNSDDAWSQASCCLVPHNVSAYLSVFTSLNALEIVKHVKQEERNNKIKLIMKSGLSHMLRYINK